MWQVEGDAALCRGGECLICLARSADGTVLAQIEPRAADPDCPFRLDPAASLISPEFGSRFFVSESAAPQLEAALREGPMQIVAMLRRDGILVNRRLEPRPKAN